MRISKLVGVRSKDNPADAVIKSHSLLMRAGYIKSVGSGIWTLATPAKRAVQKIERIIREEMDRIGGQEVSFPVVMPRELWEESGRFTSIGEEMARFTDRNNRGLVLGMTHEEASVHFARDSVTSYQQLPFMVYQLQTKFRDEARPRGGLIRVREFTMKDAYSFHLTENDLDIYYEKAFKAYENIFRRIGMKNFVAVQSDSGMMGGSMSHEFMLLADCGEDTLVLCDKCGYRANMEVAESVITTTPCPVSNPKEEVFTADKKEISEVSAFLKVPQEKTIKAVFFNIKGESGSVLCFVRGDLEVNESKLKKVIKKDIAPQSLSDSKELVAGNIGPIGLKLKNTVIVYDSSLKGANNMVVGANKQEYHIINISEARDLKISEFHDIAKVKDGACCVKCGGELRLSGGIEIGNIFKLGTKYTKSMDMTVLNANGESVNPIMGCYGIGVGRALASVVEETADAKGLNFPMAIAPWQVYLCPLRIDDKTVSKKAEKLYADMEKAGIEVLFDDRDASPGYKFSDCDLMGIPIRVVISPRSLQNDEVEIQIRGNDNSKQNLKYKDCIKAVKEIICKY
ncbi:MAG: proline--tRNA ligase [Firmicutes bacterium]|nr:proline--tRNA ligase [Bacillota bacterium]